tara:strand:+ start:442 stop:966 length:525 start_codon:yes stop_codon:yes gene_type:complete
MRKSYLDTSEDESDEEECIKKYKIIIIGDKKVGKTSFIKRLKSNEFSIQYTPTRTIEIYNDISLGDIKVDVWDVPPNVCMYYNVSTLQSDVIIMMFDSNKKESLEKGIHLYNTLRHKLYKDTLPEMWFVYRGKATNICTEYCHPDRIFKIDNMSRDGILDLIYDIRCKLIRQYH